MNHKIANASFFAALMVAGIHTAGRHIDAASKDATLWWWEAVGHYGVFLVAVPFFFMCSGYFLAGHMQEDGWWKRECGKRVRTLFVPYAIWSFVYAMIPFAAFVLSNLAHGRLAFPGGICNPRFWAGVFGLNPFAWPHLVPLWYVRALLIFVAVSPLLFRLAKRGGGIVAIWLFSITVGIYGFYSHDRAAFLMLTKCFNVSGLFYFCCGIYGRLNNVRLPQRGHAVALVAGLCLAVVNGYCRMSGIKCIIPLWIPLLMFGLWKFVPKRPLPRWLTGAAFAIYVMHTVMYRCLGIAFHWTVGDVPQWIAKWTVGVCGSLLASLALRRLFPKAAAVAFGGR